jgi:hypothetical protein
MAQFIAPGGCCTLKFAAEEFHSTPQPMARPWPEPAVPRLTRFRASSWTTLSARRPGYCTEASVFNVKKCFGFVTDSARILGALEAA